MNNTSITTRQELIKEYIRFFKLKKHKEIPSASLIPENDPTVLFTTAGMHPLVPYLLGQPHPLGKKLTNVQKCIRTGDIDNVGDEFHHTFFEMLGNWSLGDYFKKEAIEYAFEFLTKALKIKKEKLAVTCFEGNKNAPKDNESEKVWLSLGISKERIAFLPEKDNWWGPAGKTGPCGPDTEVFYWKKSNEKTPEKFNPKDKNWIEIWNCGVFMQYNKNINEKYEELKQKNVDTGMGVERTIAILNGFDDNYKSSIFRPIISKIEELSKKKYENANEKDKKSIRIVADHIRASVFILGDERGIKPSNVEQGYVLRRLIRRSIRYGKLLGIKSEKPFTSEIAKEVINIYQDYPEIKRNEKLILSELEQEENKFAQTLEKGLKKFDEIVKESEKHNKTICGKDAFLLFQSYGFPIEMTQELAKENKIKLNLNEYECEMKKHQELSRTSSAGMFKSGLADNSEMTTKLHTATHLLNEALKEILNNEDIKQKGSNITPERLRFDFNFPRKLTNEELKKIEDLVNKKINESLEVKREEMPITNAIKSGAQAEFGAKYPSIVCVYTVEEKNKENKTIWFSKEICTGPHVKNTKELGHFKIIKEESVAAGIRRIKAILE
ncbi:MAG TPA: alanine--tRNA ligase [Candidatus Paceibacterota bacterium]|nr:alanine--tRNA ligase [Candidatus Paceibacterota bacterium]